MAYVPYRKGTLLIPCGSASKLDAKHLFVILTDKCSNSRHLLVNFATVPNSIEYDDTCIVEPGEHKFIQHRSYVYYRMARIEAADKLMRMVDSWYYKRQDDVSEELSTRMLQGMSESDFVPQHITQYCQSL